MACIHKFASDLNLEQIDFEPTTLIVGTFNPGWDNLGNYAHGFMAGPTITIFGMYCRGLGLATFPNSDEIRGRTRLIEKIIEPCKSGKIAYYGDINGWELPPVPTWENDPIPYPDIQGKKELIQPKRFYDSPYYVMRCSPKQC
ncbi:hypothetical protein [Methyloglobulus sp.]|uniref:hypothetical protein n=1 Tax=Methyloglobulus sp. TaxID=2518622 RepID=UPI0039896495